MTNLIPISSTSLESLVTNSDGTVSVVHYHSTQVVPMWQLLLAGLIVVAVLWFVFWRRGGRQVDLETR